MNDAVVDFYCSFTGVLLVLDPKSVELDYYLGSDLLSSGFFPDPNRLIVTGLMSYLLVSVSSIFGLLFLGAFGESSLFEPNVS